MANIFNNNLDLRYLNYSTPTTSYTPSSSSTSSSPSQSTTYSKNNSQRNYNQKNQKNQTNQKNQKDQKNKELNENLTKLTNSNYNRMFQSNAYSQFKTQVREELRKVTEKQYEGLMRIKSLRQDKRYEEGIKMQYEKLKKMKTETEKSMYQIREYLDYIEVNKNSNNQFLPYLIGFESRYKIGEIVIPDIIGFTIKNRPEIRDQYMWFIFMMVKQFLGDLGYLYESIDTLYDHLRNQIPIFINNNDISLNLCEFYRDTPEMKALYNINNYYNLLSDILENGKFNINKFFSDPSAKKEDKIKRGGAPTKPSKQQSSIYKAFSSLSSLSSFGKKKSSLLNDNKKGDAYEKKVKYILKNEALSLNKPEIGSTSKFDTLKKYLKDKGKEIFTDKLKNNLEKIQTNPKTKIDLPPHAGSKINDINDIKDELTNKLTKNLDKKDKDFLDDLLKKIKSDPEYAGAFTEIVNLCDTGKSYLSYRDFYTGKEYPSNETTSSGDDKYYYDILKLYKSYEKFYNTYGIKNLPLSSDSKTAQKKIGLNILKGIGNYCSIVREFLIESIRRVESNDVLVREKERVERLKREKEERNQRDRQNKQERNQREKQERPVKQEREENQEKQSVNKNALLKKKIERINKEISEAKSNVVKKKLEELKLKIMKS
jgi:hypothetical protein